MSDTDFQSQITARYDAPMYRAMLEVYGDQIHPGLFETGDEELQPAALKATMRLAELAAIRSGCSILETACGVGGTARYLAATFDAQVVATNISKGQLETAVEWTQGRPGGDLISYEFANYHELPFDDARFDVYWCQDSLLFSPDRPQAMREAARVLRPGGTIAVTDLTVVGTPDTDAAALLRDISEPGFWSLEDYARGLEDVGFEVIVQEDWSRHIPISFERIRADVIAKRARLAEIASAADVDATIKRYDVWCEASRSGHLGWGAVVGRKPAA